MEELVLIALKNTLDFQKLKECCKLISMEYHFLQGKKNLLEGVEEDKMLETISDKIGSFFDMKNLCFLFGSGTSAKAIPLMNGLYEGLQQEKDNYANDEKIFLSNIDDKGNIENVLGVLYSGRSYLADKSNPTNEEKKTLKIIISLIAKIEKYLKTKLDVLNNDEWNEEIKKTLENYRKFYSKIALRNKELSRVSIFTTNNDMFNEVALDGLSIHYFNGFSGGVMKSFNPASFNYTLSKRMDTAIDKYEPVENLVYLYKIHGSVNWIEDESASNDSFFTIKELPLRNTNTDVSVLVYPTPLKQNKSLGAPYVDLFREFQHKLLEPNTVLFVIGYSFSDEHVNDIIYRALATNSTMNLVVINDIGDDKVITKIDDPRIYRVWSSNETAGETSIHHFSEMVDKLFPTKNAFDPEPLLKQFVQELHENR